MAPKPKIAGLEPFHKTHATDSLHGKAKIYGRYLYFKGSGPGLFCSVTGPFKGSLDEHLLPLILQQE